MRTSEKYGMRFPITIAQILVAILILSAVGIAAAADSAISPTTLLSHPYTYNDQHVAVSGIVRDVEERTSQRGNEYDIFDLCDSHCVRVFTWGHPAVSEGQKLTVHGTFEVTKRVGVYTFHNEIETDEGSL